MDGLQWSCPSLPNQREWAIVLKEIEKNHLHRDLIEKSNKRGGVVVQLDPFAFWSGKIRPPELPYASSQHSKAGWPDWLFSRAKLFHDIGSSSGSGLPTRQFGFELKILQEDS